MFAIVDIAGQQFKVKKDQKVFVHHLAENEGSSVEFGNVLLIDNEGKITVGSPSIDGARVAAKVLVNLIFLPAFLLSQLPIAVAITSVAVVTATNR